MKFVLKHKILMLGILAFCLTMLVGGSIYAQTPTDPNTNQTRTDTYNDRHDYSWIGLLGLAGLLGLLGRKREVAVRHEETGMPRTAAR